MDKVYSALTVYFEEPYWVGVFERSFMNKLSAVKVTFGAEPSDSEIYAFILNSYGELSFSPAVAADAKKEIKNPKRLQREVHRLTSQVGVGTKSQQALKLLQEQRKNDRKAKKKDNKLLDQKRRFELKQQKRKDRHRGK